MYTLRTIDSDSFQMNQSLGERYNVVDRFSNYEHFCRCFKAYFNTNHVADLDELSNDDSKNVYSFVTYGPYGETIKPIDITQQNYIMTESGKTFAKLS